ncbi:hypothetical protein RDI58_028781 [Solanum bulbocastanum]
MDILDTL